MAASYASGAATSPTNLLQALVSFLVAQGWTSDMSTSVGAGWRAHLHKGSMYVNLRASVNESVWTAGNQAGGYSLNLYAGTGFNALSNWDAQAGGPIQDGGSNTVGVGMTLVNGSLASHHIFDDGNDNIVVVAEPVAGKFGYVGFGPLVNKLGATWTGGPYFFGSQGHYRANMTVESPGYDIDSPTPLNAGQNFSGSARPWATYFVRADVDSFTGKWLAGSTPTNGSSSQSGATGKTLVSPLKAQIYTVYGGWTVSTLVPSMETYQDRATAAANGEAILLPVPLYATMDDGNVGLLGVVDSVYLATGVGNGYAAKDVVSRGSKDYMLFPNFGVYKGA